MANITKEVWARDIAEKLLPENTFLMESVDDDMWVEDNSKVNRANAGSLPNVEENRTTVPAPITQRTDINTEYPLSEFTSDPTLIRDVEEVEVNYGKRQSVLSGHVKQINLKIANSFIYNWAATDSSAIIRTNGGDRLTNTVGGTGNRKMITLDEIFKAMLLLDDMDVPSEGRNLLLPAHFYSDLIQNNKQELLSLEQSGKARMQDGVIQQILGFNIWKRGKKNVLTYSNAATPVPRVIGSTSGATTANAAALFWQKDFVTRAKSKSVKVFANIDEAALYGSVFSALARAGGRQLYTDGLGVGAIVEAAST